MKKNIQILIVCFWALTTGIWAQQTLPTSGEYYVIKNYSSSTCIGGSGSGSGAVKHEASGTNDNYHVFLVSGDNTNGYTLKQQYTGNFVQAAVGNSWTMAYSGTSSLFTLSDQADNFTILRKGQSNGVGADNASAGQTLYSDKLATAMLPNKWLFDATEANTILVAQLTAAITDAQALHDANSSFTEASGLQTAITAANSATSGTSAAMVAAIASLKTAVTTFSSAIATAYLASDTEFFIKIGDAYYLNNPGVATLAGNINIKASNSGLVADRNISASNQIFTITPISGSNPVKYKIFSALDESANYSIDNGFRHITENVRYATNSYSGNDSWRTFNFLYNGTKYAIKVADGNNSNATDKGLWAYDSSTQRLGITGNTASKDANNEVSNVGGTARTNVLASDYIIDVISVKDIYAEEISAGRTLYNNATQGTGPGQYAQAVMESFDAALDAAETIVTAGTATKINLFAYAAAKAAFVFNPYSTTDVSALEAAISNAQTFLADNAGKLSSDGTVGTYSSSLKDALDAAIVAARSFIDNDADGSWLINDVTIQTTTVNNAFAALQASYVAYATNALADGDYFIKVGGYYFNNPGTLGTVNNANYTVQLSSNTLTADRNIAAANQIITITKESTGRYSFFSALYEEGVSNSGAGAHYRNINENVAFRSDYGGTGELAWRTQHIYFNGTNYAIKDDGSSAAKGMWGFDADAKKAGFTGNGNAADGKIGSGNRTALDVDVDFVFELIPVATVYAEEVVRARALLDDNAENIGDGEGQYLESVYSALQTEASVEGNATTEQLVALGQALKAFLPNSATSGVSGMSAVSSISAGKGYISILTGEVSDAEVYNSVGKLVVKSAFSGSKTISVSSGLYIVKVGGNIRKIIVE